MNGKKICVVGLGWLGKPLALDLASSGHQISGTVTSKLKIEGLLDLNISATVYRLGETFPEELKTSDIFIVTIPPSSKNYVQNLSVLVSSFNSKSKIIFISSSSVYPATNGYVKEEDAEDLISPHSGISMMQAENIFKNSAHDISIVRMAGLYGPNRNPAKFMAGKKDVKGANSPVNLIHQEDCIGVIKAVISKNYWNQIFNACSDGHPSREEFYTKAAEVFNLEPPTFTQEEIPFKIVSNAKSKEVLGYSYKYPDPMKSLTS